MIGSVGISHVNCILKNALGIVVVPCDMEEVAVKRRIQILESYDPQAKFSLGRFALLLDEPLDIRIDKVIDDSLVWICLDERIRCLHDARVAKGALGPESNHLRHDGVIAAHKNDVALFQIFRCD